jgi:hypothetical protein
MGRCCCSPTFSGPQFWPPLVSCVQEVQIYYWDARDGPNMNGWTGTQLLNQLWDPTEIRTEMDIKIYQEQSIRHSTSWYIIPNTHEHPKIKTVLEHFEDMKVPRSGLGPTWFSYDTPVVTKASEVVWCFCGWRHGLVLLPRRCIGSTQDGPCLVIVLSSHARFLLVDGVTMGNHG